MFGSHLLKHWRSTQKVVALSSGGAEYYALVRVASVGRGHRGLLGGLGVGVGIDVWVDATAARGIGSRRGLGKVRHIEVALLWVQDVVRNKTIRLHKVDGTANPANILTK